jgi:hypothetical protein
MSAYEKQLTWDREVGEFVAVEPGQRVRTPNDNWWDKAYYGPSLEIASHARNALLAVVAIIRHRRGSAREKTSLLSFTALKSWTGSLSTGFNSWTELYLNRRLP